MERPPLGPPTDAPPPTIEHLIEYLAPGALTQPIPSWPPDAFAICGAILHRSGCYTHVVKDWPPLPPNVWEPTMKRLGREWRDGYNSSRPPPPDVQAWWTTVVDGRTTALPDLHDCHGLCEALLQLVATSDEACDGIGIPGGPDETFDDDASELLQRDPATLSRLVHPSRLIVLPKMHTPQSGLTLRSLTHNIALCHVGDLAAVWSKAPVSTIAPGRSMNILVVPWPTRVTPRDFVEVQGTSEIRNLPNKRYGFFEYDPKPSATPAQREAELEQLMNDADRLVGDGHIDAVVLPELALNEEEATRLSAFVLQRRAMFISGVRTQHGHESMNTVRVDVPLPKGTPPLGFVQMKHHRWRLDRRQIVQYGLGATLDPTKLLWEHIHIGKRRLNFVSLQAWLTMCVLICEDLAQQDPVADVVRAVGPNLVIALLMDGPQLSARWPARYATVLADDPGASVLTVTSVGMAELSRPAGADPKRIVAMWKDAKTGVVEIGLPADAKALLLSIAVERCEEWSADGRSDEGATGYPFLAGIHAVR
jgi:hypothetical protein